MNLEKKYLWQSVRFSAVFVVLIWLIKLLEIIGGESWSHWGILPRHLQGISGVFLAPLLHGSIAHLLSNTLPLFILLSTISYFYREIVKYVFLVSYLFTNTWVWLFARESYHIGASGLVYSFFGFLVFSGILRRQRALLTISLITIFMYGGTIWGIFPQALHISWESHLFGFFTGIILAYYFKDKELSIKDKNNILDDDPEYKRDFWNDVIEK